jgi:hypothetical protein
VKKQFEINLAVVYLKGVGEIIEIGNTMHEPTTLL